MHIGDKIRKVRELKGYKQEYVADELGMSVTAYGNLERGESSPSFDRLEEIAKVLEVSVQDILNIPEHFNVQSIVNSQVGFNQKELHYYANQKSEEQKGEIESYRHTIEHLEKEIEFQREQIKQLMEIVGKK